jgi:hypothetical protein
MVLLIKCSDKKNENKKVAVNEVQPASAARDAIQYSMLVSISISFRPHAAWTFLYLQSIEQSMT